MPDCFGTSEWPPLSGVVDPLEKAREAPYLLQPLPPARGVHRGGTIATWASPGRRREDPTMLGKILIRDNI
jgi:hypothetical protein